MSWRRLFWYRLVIVQRMEVWRQNDSCTEQVASIVQVQQVSFLEVNSSNVPQETRCTCPMLEILRMHLKAPPVLLPGALWAPF